MLDTKFTKHLISEQMMMHYLRLQ